MSTLVRYGPTKLFPLYPQGPSSRNPPCSAFRTCTSINFVVVTRSLPVCVLCGALKPPIDGLGSRDQLAKAIRQGPVQASLLLGGVDKKPDGKGVASLYWMDYLGTQQKVRWQRS